MGVELRLDMGVELRIDMAVLFCLVTGPPDPKELDLLLQNVHPLRNIQILLIFATEMY